MSVIIDMDKPERCGMCPLRNGAKCVLHDVFYDDWQEEYAHCPLRPAQERERWIPVAEGLPKGADTSGELCENVNLLLDDGLVTCGWMNGITGKVYYLAVREDYIQRTPISKVTHWMPLPKPPKEEDET